MASFLLLLFISLVSAAPKSHHHLRQSLVRQVATTSIPSYAIDYGMLGNFTSMSPYLI